MLVLAPKAAVSWAWVCPHRYTVFYAPSLRLLGDSGVDSLQFGEVDIVTRLTG